MQNQPPRLLVQVTIHQPGAFDGKGNAPLGGPADQVGQQMGVVGQKFPLIAAVEIRGKIGNARAARRLAHHQAGDAGIGHAHPRRFGRKHREFGDKSERHNRPVIHF